MTFDGKIIFNKKVKKKKIDKSKKIKMLIMHHLRMNSSGMPLHALTST